MARGRRDGDETEVGRWARGRQRGAEVQPSVGSGDLGQDGEDARERKPGAERRVETERGGSENRGRKRGEVCTEPG